MDDRVGWKCHWTLEKILGDDPTVEPYEVIEGDGNLLMYGGASALWDRLIDATPTVGVFDQTNTMIGVGTSATAASATQTDLQATNDASNRHYKAQQSASYPAHTDGTSTTAHATCTFSSSFGTTEANFAWKEWAVGRGTAGAGGTGSMSGRMLNRKVQSFGTKTSADTWILTVTIELT